MDPTISAAARAWLTGHVWALDLARLEYYAPRALEHWTAVIAAGDPAASQLAATILAAPGLRPDADPEEDTLRGPVAHLRLFGFLSSRPSLSSLFFGGSTLTGLRESLARAVASPRVRSILIDIDSPGGGVYGVHETWQAIRDADARKPVTAAISGLGASAAYWLASAARRIVMTPSGDAGSIGVYGIHEDLSAYWAGKGVTHTVVSAGRYKTETLDVVPMTEESRARVQRLVDAKYAQFVGDVAAGRHTTAEAVMHGYGEGAVLCAADALAAHLVDAVEPIEATSDRLGRLAADADRLAELVALGAKWTD